MTGNPTSPAAAAECMELLLRSDNVYAPDLLGALKDADEVGGGV